MLVLERVVQVEQFRVVELVHHRDFVLHRLLVGGKGRVDELDDVVVAGRLLDGSVNFSEGTAVASDGKSERWSLSVIVAFVQTWISVRDFVLIRRIE